MDPIVTPRSANPKSRLSVASLLAWLAAGFPILVLCGLGAGTIGTAAGLYLAFSADLPKIPDLRAYRPKTVSKFYAEDTTLIGLFYTEKRFPVRLEVIPPHVVNAFLAAEDTRFFSHGGVDWVGVIRAFLRNVSVGNFAQGGSTITQQVTRTFLLSKEKKLPRKIREALLAFRLEKTLTKQEILELYLNEIYLGKGSYGIESAAGTYFGKTTAELSIAEAALLAGLVSGPLKYSPFRNLEASLKRREFVLANMVRYGYISDEEYRFAVRNTPTFREDLPNPYERVPYFTETVRRYIIAKYGERRLYNDGLQVWTTCDLPLQEKASQALLKGAASWEKRQGRPTGLTSRLKPSETRQFLSAPEHKGLRVGDTVQAVVIANQTPKKTKGKKNESNLQDCTLALSGDVRFRMELDSDLAYKANDLLLFRVAQVDGARLSLEHETLPIIEGALVCIENKTGYVRALVGGLDFERSNFNRAVQAQRQPGSAFKPFVYATALEWFDYTPRTLVIDEPIAVAIDAREPEWVPNNADGGFLGTVTLRQALANSRNVAAVKLFMDVGVEPTVRMARSMGIASPLRRHLSMSLGSSEVTPLELTSAYTVFPNAGVRLRPVLVKKVVDRFGNVLEDNTVEPLVVAEVAKQTEKVPRPPQVPGPSVQWSDQGQSADDLEESGLEDTPENSQDPQPSVTERMEVLLTDSFPSRPAAERVLSPQTAYLMTSMLRETCVSGTAAGASRLGRRDLAGKTGTTDDCTDAWFVGFNPRYTVGVWMGCDAKVSLGRREHGNIAALPVWMNYMKEVLSGQPAEQYPIPPGIVFPDESVPGKTERRPNPLEAGPDLPPAFQLKLVSPVDAMLLPGQDYAAISDGQPTDSFFMPMAYRAPVGPFPPDSGTVRVLSVTGQTLGFGYLTRDDRGKTVVHRESFIPYFQDQPHEPAQDFGPNGAYYEAPQFLQGLPRFMPRRLQGGEIQ